MWLNLLLMCCFAEQGTEMLRQDIQRLTSGQSVRYAVAFRNPSRGEELLIGADVEMHAASTVKVPVMLRLFQMVQEEKLKLDQLVMVDSTFKSIVDNSPYTLDVNEDGDGELYRALGQTRTVRQLIEAMMIHSGNLATNLLMNYADGPSTTAMMRSLGAKRITVLRGVQDLKAFEAGRNNTCSAEDMLTLVLAVANDERIPAEMRENMLGIMRRCAHREMIVAGIPSDAGAIIANKTGRISSVEHDAAVIDLRDGTRYGLVIFCDGIDSEVIRSQVLETGRKISRRVFEHVNSP